MRSCVRLNTMVMFQVVVALAHDAKRERVERTGQKAVIIQEEPMSLDTACVEALVDAAHMGSPNDGQSKKPRA